MSREHPSRHGAIVGHALAQLEQAGRAAADAELPPMCATCAFRPGCMTNLMAATVLEAFKCAVGADDSLFVCHHGMTDGEPSRVCAGWVAAQLAEFETVKAICGQVAGGLANLHEDGPDPIREAFDLWISTVDPDGKLDDYQRGRLFLRAFPDGLAA